MSSLSFLGVIALAIAISGNFATASEQLSMYEVTPQNKHQLQALFGLEVTYPGIILWSKLGDLGEKVQFMAKREHFEHFKRQILDDLDMEASMVFPHLKITASDNENVSVDEAYEKISSANIPHKNQITFQSYSHLQASSAQPVESIPIRQIPDTDINSGMYYRLKVKSTPNAYLSYANPEKIQDGLVPFIGNYKELLLNTKKYDDYKIGGSSENAKDPDWMFLPCDDEPGWYFLVNRDYSGSSFRPVTYLSAADKPGTGYLVTMGDKPDQGPTLDKPVYKEHRASYLWKPVRTEDGYYMIYNKDRGGRGFLTFAAMENKEWGNLAQLVNVNGDQDSYARNFPNDIKWEFIPGAIELSAEISNFNYQIPPLSVLESMASKGEDRTLVFTKNIENRGSAEITATITKAFSIADKFSWGLKEEIKASVKTKVEAGIPWIVEGQIETGLEILAGSHQDWETVKTSTFTFAGAIKVPAKASVAVSGYVEMLRDVSFPFKANMALKGRAVGRISREGGETMAAELDGNAVIGALKSKGMSYTVVAKTANAAICQVSGDFKGTFAFRVVMESHDILKGSMAANLISKRSRRPILGLEAKARFCERIR